MSDMFDAFNWHSCIGIDCILSGDKKVVTRMKNTKQARDMFFAAGHSVLVHKTTRCLWKISDDKTCIEPVFSNDVLTEEDVHQAMEEVK